MNDLLLTTFLNKEIQIGETSIPFSFIILVVFFISIIASFNIIYLNHYNEVMSYLKRYHPNLYRQVYRRPDIGPFYSTTHNSSKPLIDLAKRSRMLDDTQLTDVLSNFVKFERKLTWISSITIVGSMMAAFALLVILSFLSD